ncbi:hypothetical protein OPIT5_13010 [Opitutaceae bacterium TAV5]|nr:hypothetical protein OPIT5_13010 [Opitutaceae bacterium TAV5]
MKTFLKILAFSLLAPLACHSATIYIDFGSSANPTTVPGWNNITVPGGGSNVPLIDSTGAATPLTLSCTAFGDANPSSGTANPTGDAAYPSTATQDNLFACAVAGGSFQSPQASVPLTIKRSQLRRTVRADGHVEALPQNGVNYYLMKWPDNTLRP